jgi:hypothetical protein
VDPNAPQSAGITGAANVPRAPQLVAAPDNISLTELEKTRGLLYTIQLGVYGRQQNKKRFLDLSPVYSEKLPDGNFRYTAGIYNNAERLIADKKKVNALGIRDAFATAYLDGKRIAFAEGRTKQASESGIRMERENPIVFPGETPIVANETVIPFRNEVASYPASSPDNGVKQTQDGVCFKVQIGAFSRQVPPEVAAKFAAVKNWPVEHKLINGLYIYHIGNFTEARYAKALRDEAAGLGINDAFITVYRDGNKLFGAEATELLRR